MPVDVSICVVTFRRPLGLDRLLASLARLKLPEALVAEIVIVDNDPAGSAIRSEGRPESAGLLPIRWHHETGRDISRARNRCIQEASGRWIAFIDDDESAHESWLAAYAEIAERVEADGFFGPVLPRLEQPRDSWLDLETFYARKRRTTGETLGFSGPCTANAFLRRTLLREVPFDAAFGQSGGEDTDCFLRALERGSRFVWCDEARVDEFIPPERHRPRFLLRRALEGASNWARIQADRTSAPLFWQLCVASLRVLAAALLVPLACLAGRRCGFMACMRVCTQLGRLHGTLGARFQWTDG